VPFRTLFQMIRIRSANYPVALAVLYINIPLVLFYYYWLINPWKILAATLFAGLTFYQIYTSGNIQIKLSVLEKTRILLFTVALILISGITGIGGSSTLDLIHHLQKTYDFSAHSLPIYYDNASSYASYYFGFYIVPGLLLKYVTNIHLLLAIWELLGLYFGLTWLYLICKRNFYHVLLLFFISGVLSFIMPLLEGKDLLSSSYFYFYDTRWNLLPMYLSLRWVPNQFIYTLIVTGMVLYLRPKELVHLSSLFIAGLFWAPFVAIVLGIIYLIKVWPEFAKTRVKNLSLYLGLNVLATLGIALFLLSNQTSGELEFTLTSSESIINYLLLILGEIIIFYILTEKRYKLLMEMKITIVLLIFLPMVKLGAGNDLYSRATMPLLLILYLYFIKSLSYPSQWKWAKILLISIVSFLPLKYIASNLKNFSWEPHYVPSEIEDTYDLILRDYQSKTVANQYLMEENSIFYKYLLDKKIPPKTSGGIYE
jgi:hypothetical protein